MKLIIIFCGLLLLHTALQGQVLNDITTYLNNKEISTTAKDLYNGKYKAGDNKKTMSVLDSLKTSNDSTRPFYIYLVSKLMNTSDGALSETLGLTSKEFIEQKPNELIEFLYSSNKIVDRKFIENWASMIASEIMISCEGEEKKCVRKSLQQTMVKIKAGNKTKLSTLYKRIEALAVK